MRVELTDRLILTICEVYEFGTQKGLDQIQALFEKQGETPEEAKRKANLIVSDEASCT